MQYELATNGVGAQYFVGEGQSACAGGGSAGANGLKGICVIPADYYSHPEVYEFELDQSPWTFTEERRASLALYDYRKLDDNQEWAPLEGEQRIVLGPRSWRTPQIWDRQVQEEAAPEFVRPKILVIGQALNRAANW